jgi:transcription elongation factor GreA
MNFRPNSRRPSPWATSQENAEYHMAKQRQEFVRARLGMMKKRMAELSLMNLANIPRDRAALGSTLVVFDSTKDEEIVYKLVTSEESDVTKGMVSTTSPIGRALMGKKVGDVTDGGHSRRHARAGGA